MKNTTLYLPGFHLATLRRSPRCAAQKLADEWDRGVWSRFVACGIVASSGDIILKETLI
jgi:hypothetical protein